MEWKHWLTDWRFAAGTLVAGGPGLVDDIQEWVEILGVNVLVTLALMGLTAHIVAVGFSDWQPYRGWWHWFRQSRPFSGTRQARLWKVSPGAGRLAARAIREAPTLERARAIFDAHYASPNPKDTAWAAHVLVMRMDAAGEDVMPLIHKLTEEGIDITEHLDAINQEFGDGPS